jgi:hypothetical protein
MHAHLCQCGLKWWVFRHESLATYNGHMDCFCGRQIISWNGSLFFTTKLADKPQEETPRFDDLEVVDTLRRTKRE